MIYYFIDFDLLVIAFILVVPATMVLILGSSVLDARAAPRDFAFDVGECTESKGPYTGIITSRCCWDEWDPVSNKFVSKCQICEKKPGEKEFGNCGDVETEGPPLTGNRVPPRITGELVPNPLAPFGEPVRTPEAKLLPRTCG